MIDIIAWLSIFLITVVFHEVAHGFVAYQLGDDTARRAGRLTLNPLKHIDPFWTVIFPAMLFFSTGGRFAIGMAKPVPVDFWRLRDRKRGMILVALAGPFVNFILACLFNVGFKVTENIFFLYGVYFNLGLAFFNLIPIPPLDGSRVLAGLLPKKLEFQYMKLERYGFIIILVLYFTGILFQWVIPGINFVCRLFEIPQLGLN